MPSRLLFREKPRPNGRLDVNVSDAPPQAAAPPKSPPPAAPPSPTRRRPAPAATELPPWQRLHAALSTDPMAYLSTLPLTPGARPATLQPALLRPHHTPADLCRPRPSACGTRLIDLPLDSTGRLAPLPGVAQCLLALGTIKGVPQCGAEERTPCGHVLRACLYDGHRFHGAAGALHPRRVKPGKRGTATWSFDAPLLLRCPAELLPRAQLYLELCVSHELTAEEAERLPHGRSAHQADEVCVAWTLLGVGASLATLHTARSLQLPLCGGPLAHRRPLRECIAAALNTRGATRAASIDAASRFGATLPLRLSPLQPAEAAAAGLLPAAVVAAQPLARALACYRQLLAEALGSGGEQGCASLAAVGDPALASFPAVLRDADLADVFMGLWEAALAPRKGRPAPTTAAELGAAFGQCATAVWAAAGAQALPARAIGNASRQRAERRRQLQQFMAQHPAVGLGAAAHAWLHRPFDAAELRCGPLQGLGATV